MTEDFIPDSDQTPDSETPVSASIPSEPSRVPLKSWSSVLPKSSTAPFTPSIALVTPKSANGASHSLPRILAK